MVEKLFPDPFLKNQNWIYSESIVCFIIFISIVCPGWGQSKYIETNMRSYKTQKEKTKTGLELVSLPYFLHNFWRKIFLRLYFYWLTKVHCLFACTPWDIGQYVCCNLFVSQIVTLSIWKITLVFFSRRFPTWLKKSEQKFKYLKSLFPLISIKFLFFTKW